MLAIGSQGPVPPASGGHALEAWGGAECTINRIGGRFRDQLVETGHLCREGDWERIASLGLTALRVAVHWERISASEDWTWCDRAIEATGDHGIRPIVGLVHHGSGPAHTSLVDDGFAPGLAAHAERVARRYPHVEDWTPVNEPLTTARFSALYGLWYPHARDERLFWLALLNQIDGTRLAMRAIRKVQPAARLIQTEDLGRTYATDGLRDQAAFDNQRRWMTWDLLCGRVDPGHPLWERLCRFGFEYRLRAILRDPCPPDVIGINHYLTSDRLLDQRIHRYPAESVGGNASAAFCDIEAIRALDPAPRGLARAIDDAWQRYRLPIALTEIHNGCTREEQVRWLDEAWATARAARARGVNVQAVTAWALFGSSGWNTLLTDKGAYEPGVFDVSSGTPRETALAQVVRERGGAWGGTPWWRRAIRLVHPAVARPAPIADWHQDHGATARAPLMILGASGTLGRALASECRQRDIAHVLVGRADLDLCRSDSIERAFAEHEPWAVVNAAGWVRVDDAEDDEDACHAANHAGAVAVARACARNGIPSVNFSTDLVFDGVCAEPYVEQSSPRPLNAYGRSKLAMEDALADLAGQHLVVRTAAFFSPHDPYNFAFHCAEAAVRAERFVAVADCAVSPTYVPDLCRAALDLLIDRETGLWHLTNGEAVTWFGFAARLLDALKADNAMLVAGRAAEANWRAARPRYSALASTRGRLMPGLESAIARFAEARRSAAVAPNPNVAAASM